MPGPLFLDGDGVTLHPATEEDVPFLVENENDPRIRRTTSRYLPRDEEYARKRLGGTMGRDGNTICLLVCAEGDPVGFVYLVRERPNDEVNRHGELAYWITADAWGNGYATAASKALLDHAFDRLNLHRVTAKAFEDNTDSRQVLEKLGFAEEGASRDAAYLNGEYRDFVRYGLLREEWNEADGPSR